jgi:hypothetical protein
MPIAASCLFLLDFVGTRACVQARVSALEQRARSAAVFADEQRVRAAAAPFSAVVQELAVLVSLAAVDVAPEPDAAPALDVEAEAFGVEARAGRAAGAPAVRERAEHAFEAPAAEVRVLEVHDVVRVPDFAG